MKLELWQINALAHDAQELVANDLDWCQPECMPQGYVLALFTDGVWLCDGRFTCDMDAMPRIVCLNGPND